MERSRQTLYRVIISYHIIMDWKGGEEAAKTKLGSNSIICVQQYHLILHNNNSSSGSSAVAVYFMG